MDLEARHWGLVQSGGCVGGRKGSVGGRGSSPGGTGQRRETPVRMGAVREWGPESPTHRSDGTLDSPRRNPCSGHTTRSVPRTRLLVAVLSMSLRSVATRPEGGFPTGFIHDGSLRVHQGRFVDVGVLSSSHGLVSNNRPPNQPPDDLLASPSWRVRRQPTVRLTFAQSQTWWQCRYHHDRWRGRGSNQTTGDTPVNAKVK